MIDDQDRAYATERWAELVVSLLDSVEDPRTLTAWGQAVGLGTSALRARCYAARVQPKNALRLARLLRVIVRCGGNPFDPAEALNILDLRTLKKLLAAGGLLSSEDAVATQGWKVFLETQTFVVRETARQALFSALCARLSSGFDPALRPRGAPRTWIDAPS